MHFFLCGICDPLSCYHRSPSLSTYSAAENGMIEDHVSMIRYIVSSATREQHQINLEYHREASLDREFHHSAICTMSPSHPRRLGLRGSSKSNRYVSYINAGSKSFVPHNSFLDISSRKTTTLPLSERASDQLIKNLPTHFFSA